MKKKKQKQTSHLTVIRNKQIQKKQSASVLFSLGGPKRINIDIKETRTG